MVILVQYEILSLLRYSNFSKQQCSDCDQPYETQHIYYYVLPRLAFPTRLFVNKDVIRFWIRAENLSLNAV